MRLLLALLLFLPSLVSAQGCQGRDMRAHLSPSQQAELDQRLAGVPFATGNHWIAQRGDHTVHLIGTIHLYDPRLEPIAQRLAPLIAEADVLLAEAGPGDEMRLQAHLAQNPNLIRMPGASLIDRLDPDTWQSVADAARARGVPPAMAAQMQPWYLSLALAMPPCLMQQMQTGQRGLDHMLMDLAQDSGTAVQALEPYTTIIDLFATEPIEAQIAALHLGLLSTQQGTDAIVTLTEQFFAEDHAAVFPMNAVLAKGWLDMDEAQFEQLFAEMLEALLYTRNRNWMPVILQTQGTVIVASGAGHLGGTGGLIDLMQSAGYTVTQAAF